MQFNEWFMACQSKIFHFFLFLFKKKEPKSVKVVVQTKFMMCFIKNLFELFLSVCVCEGPSRGLRVKVTQKKMFEQRDDF